MKNEHYTFLMGKYYASIRMELLNNLFYGNVHNKWFLKDGLKSVHI